MYILFFFFFFFFFFLCEYTTHKLIPPLYPIVKSNDRAQVYARAAREIFFSPRYPRGMEKDDEAKRPHDRVLQTRE